MFEGSCLRAALQDTERTITFRFPLLTKQVNLHFEPYFCSQIVVSRRKDCQSSIVYFLPLFARSEG